MNKEIRTYRFKCTCGTEWSDTIKTAHCPHCNVIKPNIIGYGTPLGISDNEGIREVPLRQCKCGQKIFGIGSELFRFCPYCGIELGRKKLETKEEQERDEET